jgi:sporulation protein YlmC with PRC-barrel domain
MSKEDNYVEKKLRGSGGYTIAKINDQEQKMANLGGPELFLAGIGRLENDRFIKYYCNRCEKGYEGAPAIQYENPNEDLGENIILIEKGEYKCRSCDYIIAQYRKFNELKDTNNIPFSDNNIDLKQNENSIKESTEKPKSNNQVTIVSEDNRLTTSNDKETEFNPIEKILGIYTYNNNAQLIGKVNEIGLKISNGKAQFSFKITNTKKETIEIVWEDIDKIGDIIILSEKSFDTNTQSIKSIKSNNNSIDKNQNFKVCTNCKYKNDIEAIFCEECGKKILE